MMFAVAHDYRLQREDRGFMCAIEVEIGVGIPPPEMEVSRTLVPAPGYSRLWKRLRPQRWATALPPRRLQARLL